MDKDEESLTHSFVPITEVQLKESDGIDAHARESKVYMGRSIASFFVLHTTIKLQFNTWLCACTSLNLNPTCIGK